MTFEDGDILFVSHRMKLKGEIGPQIKALGKKLTMSISRSGFNLWKENNPFLNGIAF
eukprot:CAMPEP_0194395488 /NCGR_PEP_ID=MMETSP0174-20130528/124452_1 /TAXON_ID=216777 /ORGANISM="Proboscia alata, Strain PI-D3" /LENGTH=56 /DNA_ID=CAMNT_0039191431 /DNA_START=1088 /DNA_END=1255 /DNA_ORIENTATION=+